MHGCFYHMSYQKDTEQGTIRDYDWIYAKDSMEAKKRIKLKYGELVYNIRIEETC